MWGVIWIIAGSRKTLYQIHHGGIHGPPAMDPQLATMLIVALDEHFTRTPERRELDEGSWGLCILLTCGCALSEHCNPDPERVTPCRPNAQRTGSPRHPTAHRECAWFCWGCISRWRIGLGLLPGWRLEHGRAGSGIDCPPCGWLTADSTSTPHGGSRTVAERTRLSERGQGAADRVRKLLHLKDTWESVVFVLYALILGEVRHKGIDLKAARHFVSLDPAVIRATPISTPTRSCPTPSNRRSRTSRGLFFTVRRTALDSSSKRSTRACVTTCALAGYPQ